MKVPNGLCGSHNLIIFRSAVLAFFLYGCVEPRQTVTPVGPGAGGSGSGGGAPTGGQTGSGGQAAMGGQGPTGGQAGWATGGSGGMPPGGGVGAAGGAAVGAAGAGGQPANLFGDHPDRNKVQPGNICDRLATIQCAGEALCCDNPGRDFQTCKQQMMPLCAAELMIDSISLNPITGFDAVHAERAFSEYERRTSACDVAVVSWGASVEGLRGIMRGTLQPGESCWGSSALSSTEAAAAALASCADPANYACLPRLLAGSCSPLSNADGRCMTDINCAGGLYCDNPELNPSGSVCRVNRAVGSACVLPTQCESMVCQANQCVPADRQSVFCL